MIVVSDSTPIISLVKIGHLDLLYHLFEDVTIPDAVIAKPGRGFCTKVDLGIAKYHFELGAGTENFSWTASPRAK